MAIAIPENMQYVLNRGLFEQKRAASNMAFMINAHLNDEDASYLESEEFHKLKSRLVETMANRWCYECGVVISLLGNDIPKKYYFNDGYESLEI